MKDSRTLMYICAPLTYGLIWVAKVLSLALVALRYMARDTVAAKDAVEAP